MSSIPAPSFYVYVLARPNGKPFYVGKGKTHRIYDHEVEARSGHRCHKCNLIRKIWTSGGEVQRYIVFTTDNEQQAFEYERETIALYGRENLCNLTDGGEGPSGRTSTHEARANVSAGMKAYYAKTPEARIRHSVAMKARFLNPGERARRSAAVKAFIANNPEAYTKGRAANSAAMRTSEARRLAHERAKNRWADPDYRARHTASIKAAHSTPEARVQRSVTAKAVWSDPEHRAKVSASVKATKSTPEARLEASAKSKAAWARRKAKHSENNEEVLA